MNSDITVDNTSYKIRTVLFEQEKHDICAIRRRVFIEEQTIPEHDEWDEYDNDEHSTHLLASCKDQAVAYLRIVYLANGQVKITRLCVLAQHRRCGVASALIQHALKHIFSKRADLVYLHAQVDAIDLYKKFGFEAQEPIFIEAGIAHQKMQLKSTSSGVLSTLFQNDVIRLDSADAFAFHLESVTKYSSKLLFIHSQNLRADIFSVPTFVDAVSVFARKNSHAQVKILVDALGPANARTTPLIQLAQRLPSKIHIRVSTDDNDQVEHFICADSSALIYFNDEATLNGFCCYRAKPENQNKRELFEHNWAHHSRSDPNLARLSL